MPHPDSPLDPDAMANLRDLGSDDPEIFREIVGLFLEDTPLRFEEMKRALDANDAKTLERTAHSLKGGASNFGANALRELAETIEADAAGGRLSEAASRLEALRDEYERVAAALREELERS